MDLMDYYDSEAQDELYRQRVKASKSDNWVDSARGYAREGAGHIGHSVAAAGRYGWDGAKSAASDLWSWMAD